MTSIRGLFLGAVLLAETMLLKKLPIPPPWLDPDHEVNLKPSFKMRKKLGRRQPEVTTKSSLIPRIELVGKMLVFSDDQPRKEQFLEGRKFLIIGDDGASTVQALCLNRTLSPTQQNFGQWINANDGHGYCHSKGKLVRISDGGDDKKYPPFFVFDKKHHPIMPSVGHLLLGDICVTRSPHCIDLAKDGLFDPAYTIMVIGCSKFSYEHISDLLRHPEKCRLMDATPDIVFTEASAQMLYETAGSLQEHSAPSTRLH
jgi:hypothetical protein